LPCFNTCDRDLDEFYHFKKDSQPTNIEQVYIGDDKIDEAYRL
jgi:hypothetical protein